MTLVMLKFMDHLHFYLCSFLYFFKQPEEVSLVESLFPCMAAGFVVKCKGTGNFCLELTSIDWHGKISGGRKH